MPKHHALYAILLVLFVDTCASAQVRDVSSERTTWDHNGSAMYLIAKGASREFFYEKPRPGMLEAGAKAGSLLFRGEASDGQYSGTAYLFNLQCGQVPFNVKGTILDSGERIVLTGQAPRMGRNCRAYAFSSTTLEFRLVQPAATSKPPEPHKENETKGEARSEAAKTLNAPSLAAPATHDATASTKGAQEITSTVVDASDSDDNPNDKIVHSDFDNYVSAAAVMIVVAASLFFWVRQKLRKLSWRNRGFY